MKSYIAVIHHLRFYWPAEQEFYGKTAILVESASDAGEAISEVVFDMTNNPGKTPDIRATYGKCNTFSVGDVVELYLKGKKEFWLCLGSGWMEIQKSEVSYLSYKVEDAAEKGIRYDIGYKGPQDLARRRTRQNSFSSPAQ
jgi:hypothetical protein